MNKSTQQRKKELDKMSKEVLTNKAKSSVMSSIVTLKAGQHLLDTFDKQMSEKNYTWPEVKEFINNVSDHIEKELKEQKADLKDKVLDELDNNFLAWDISTNALVNGKEDESLDKANSAQLNKLRDFVKAEIAKVFE